MLTKVPSALPPEIDGVMFHVLGAAIEVHRQLGPGFLESIYQRALCVEFELRRISFDKKKRIDVIYKGHRLLGQELDLDVSRGA